MVGAHRKKIRLDDLPKLRIIEPPALLRLIIVLRLAIIFNITRWPIDLAYVELSVKPDGLHIVVDEKLIATQQLLEADWCTFRGVYLRQTFPLLVHVSEKIGIVRHD